MNRILRRTKAELKILAAQITESKKQLKQAQREGTSVWTHICARGKAQSEFRIKHIARCMLKGRTLIEIENTPRCEARCSCCDKPNMKAVQELLNEWKKEIDGVGSVGSIQEPASGSSGTCGSRVVPVQSAPVVAVGSDPGVSEGRGSKHAGGLLGALESLWRDVVA